MMDIYCCLKAACRLKKSAKMKMTTVAAMTFIGFKFNMIELFYLYVMFSRVDTTASDEMCLTILRFTFIC